MSKSCLDGYLTLACATCNYWADGSNPVLGFGCACPYPIMYCSHYAESIKKEGNSSHAQG